MPIPIPTASTNPRFPYGETVTIRTPAVEADPYSGEPGSAAEDTDVDGVAVADGGSTEPLRDGRNDVTADYDLFFPAGTNITRKHQVIVRGDVCEVVGKPFDWRHPMTGWEPGIFVQARLSEG